MSARIITDISTVKPLVNGRFYDLIVDGATSIADIEAEEIRISDGTGTVVLTTDNAGDLSVSGAVKTDEVSISNGVGTVVLTTDNSSELNVSGVVKGPGILFTNNITAQSELSIYNTENLDYAIPLENASIQYGELLCRFERIGNVVACEARGFVDFTVSSLVATAAIPTGYRPPHQVTFTIPLYSSVQIPAFVVAFCTLSTAGIITITTTVPAPAGTGLYYTGLNTVNYDRYTFSYRL